MIPFMLFLGIFVGALALVSVLGGDNTKEIVVEPKERPIKKFKGYVMSSDVNAMSIEKTSSTTQKEAMRLMSMLLDLYKPQTPFQLKVSMESPTTYMGLYYEEDRRIIVYEGWNHISSPEDTAIHEFAHLIYNDRVNKGKREKLHGPEFKKIYNNLIATAKQKGYRT